MQEENRFQSSEYQFFRTEIDYSDHSVPETYELIGVPYAFLVTRFGKPDRFQGRDVHWGIFFPLRGTHYMFDISSSRPEKNIRKIKRWIIKTNVLPASISSMIDILLKRGKVMNAKTDFKSYKKLKLTDFQIVYRISSKEM